MNKEKLLNYFKKNKVAIIIGSIVVIGGYYLTHTNFSYHLEDRTGKYILNPEYKEFHKYEWTDLKSVYPTKLAYDPAWFKLPPDKYIPKEQPIPKNISNISDPIIRRQAYFNFLCKTESINLRNNLADKAHTYEEGLLDLDSYTNFNKTKNTNILDISIQKTMSNANGNPFILPLYTKSYYPLIEGHIYNFYGIDLDINPKSINVSPFKSNKNQFIELMSPEGKLFRIEFDLKTNNFLPAINIPKSTAKFYTLKRFISREYLNNLGIIGYEQIVYDSHKKIIVTYFKKFELGAFLPWQEEGAISNFSWAKSSYCDNNKIVPFN